MQIIDHRLVQDDGTPYPFQASPNFEDSPLKPEYLVIHYTAGRNAEGAVSWLCNPVARASAHLVIGRDGGITQLVPFDKVAWHAGISQWQGRIGLNLYSIGIELDNAGKLMQHGDSWLAWFGAEYQDSEVIEAVHKHETTPAGWHLYTPEQIEAAFQVSSLLVNHYGILDIVGHEDVCSEKVDPGPAFPMCSFRARALGRENNVPVLFKTTATWLNIRSGPGTEYAPIPGSPLPYDTPVEVISVNGNWSFVSVKETVQNINDIEGWVYSPYLTRA